MCFECYALPVVLLTYLPHGDPENTGLRTTVPIYAGPTRKLYQLLELTDNLDMPASNDPKRSYYTDSFVQSVWKTLAVSEVAYARARGCMQACIIYRTGSETH
jgi:hypothetical protein